MMLRKVLFYFLFIFSYCLANTEIVAIHLEGEIEPSLYKYLKRAVITATNHNPKQIIFVINTFGGELNTTFQIVELFSSITIPTVSYVDEKAISAGTLIALSAQSLYMKNNSIMGDVAPISMGAEGPQMLGEKFQSPLRAKFRALAQKNGYPVKLSEAFVTSEKEIIEITWKDGSKTIINDIEYRDLGEEEIQKIHKKKTLVAKGELLTMSEKEALELGFSKGTIDSLDELVKILQPSLKDESNITEDHLIVINKTSAEEIFTKFRKYSWLLILIGLGGIYLEVKNPGFGFYGIVAIIALGSFFAGQYLVELASYIELIILLIGLALLAIEILVLPGFGFFGLIGMMLLLISLILMQQSFTIPQDVFEWDALQQNSLLVLYLFLGSLVVLILSFFVGSKFMDRSPLVFKKKLFNQNTTQPNVHSSLNTPTANSHQGEHLIGKKGYNETVLSPSGKVNIDGQTYDAVVSSNFLDIGKEIEVTGTDGYLLIVEVVEKSNHQS